MKRELGFNPWLGILFRPRKTIRALVEHNTNFRFITLCAIFGFLNTLQAAQVISMGSSYPMWIILLSGVILSIPIGYIFFNIWAFFLLLLGKCIKGKGTFKQIRAAYYWPKVTALFSIFIWIGLLFVYGNHVFTLGYSNELTGNLLVFNLVATVAQLGIVFWGFIIFLHALGEVQGFSSWMALLNFVLALITKVVLLFFVFWGVSALIHMS